MIWREIALHFLDGFPEFAFVGNGLLQGCKLRRAQGDAHGFLGDLSSPLIAAAARGGHRTLQHRSLADVADARQALAQPLVLALSRPCDYRGIFHGRSF